MLIANLSWNPEGVPVAVELRGWWPGDRLTVVSVVAWPVEVG